MEENANDSCPVKGFFCSKTMLTILACLLCFFIGYFAGSRTLKPFNKGFGTQYRKAPNFPRKLSAPIKMRNMQPNPSVSNSPLLKKAPAGPAVNKQLPAPKSVKAPKTAVAKIAPVKTKTSK